ncbi:MAG: c-type cytochrome [Chloroflexi bacterium]|nr:c-type cytochrome [Chloroflexota bacterium]
MKPKKWFVTAILIVTFGLIAVGCGGAVTPTTAPTAVPEPTKPSAPTLTPEPTKPSAPVATPAPQVASNSAPVIFEQVEDRLKLWQAQIPPEYAGKTNPYPLGDASAVSAGESIFNDKHCAACHGGELEGDGEFSQVLDPKPINLTDPVLMSLPFVTDTYLFWRIGEGGSQPPFFSAMPIWKMKLSEPERWQLVTFIRSRTVKEVAENEEEENQAAIAVIEKVGCFACHRLGSRGGKIGPEWDGIGTRAATRIPGMTAEEYIRQSILDPGAFAPPGFEDKAQLMPSSLGEKLTAEELDLIVEFLLRQK